MALGSYGVILVFIELARLLIWSYATNRTHLLF